MADVLAQVSGLGIVAGRGGHAWIVGKRPPPKLVPRTQGVTASGARADCGGAPNSALGALGAPQPCVLTVDMLREQGYYCPEAGEALLGIACNCYALIYVDGKLMNNQRPTEPYDINQIAPERIEGVEWYASGAQTPAQYSTLNATCGVMAIWTRRSH